MLFYIQDYVLYAPRTDTVSRFSGSEECPLLGDCKAGPGVSDSQEDSGSEEGLPETSGKCKCQTFLLTLKMLFWVGVSMPR